MVSCFMLHVTCYRKYSFPNHLFHVSSFFVSSFLFPYCYIVSCFWSSPKVPPYCFYVSSFMFQVLILFHVSGLPQSSAFNTVFMFPVSCFKFLKYSTNIVSCFLFFEFPAFGFEHTECFLDIATSFTTVILIFYQHMKNIRFSPEIKKTCLYEARFWE